MLTVGKPRERTPSSALGGLYRFPDDPLVPNTPAPPAVSDNPLARPTRRFEMKSCQRNPNRHFQIEPGNCQTKLATGTAFHCPRGILHPSR